MNLIKNYIAIEKKDDNNINYVEILIDYIPNDNIFNEETTIDAIIKENTIILPSINKIIVNINKMTLDLIKFTNDGILTICFPSGKSKKFHFIIKEN